MFVLANSDIDFMAGLILSLAFSRVSCNDQLILTADFNNQLIVLGDRHLDDQVISLKVHHLDDQLISPDNFFIVIQANYLIL